MPYIPVFINIKDNRLEYASSFKMYLSSCLDPSCSLIALFLKCTPLLQLLLTLYT